MTLQVVAAASFAWRRTAAQTLPEQAMVATIVDAVRQRGDAALRAFTAEYDGCGEAASETWPLRVPTDVMAAAWDALDAELREALQAAADRIRRFHEALMPPAVELAGSHGETMGMVWRPLTRAGVYAPGGRGAYPSTVLMDVIPAQVAGVTEIAMVSPPARGSGLPHPMVLAAAHLLGVTEVYRIGGAQAVAALAYGTASMRRVDKIVGPGNLYVALAKRQVMGDVGIDSIAGPSEVFIVADETADAAHVAADMLAQAEHDVEAGAICVSTSRTLLERVAVALADQLARLPRREIAEAALAKWGALVHAATWEDAFVVLNECAPEHVELLMEDARAWLHHVTHAGAVFLGHHTPEPVGDYYAGTNHVLPTFGSAKYASGLGVHDFLRRMSYVAYTKDALFAHAGHIVQLARSEDLEAHARAVLVRMSEEGTDAR